MRKIKNIISNTLLNLPGWHTNRKIVVIESDDWGSIRMPSREVYEEFRKKGIRVDKDPYCKYDSLATPVDLTALFEVLHSVKDIHGKPAVLTANTVTANPDFDKIKSSDFSEYFYEPFTDTLKRNKLTENSFEIWEQGMNAEVFRPQFHGREHLNVKKWMHALQSEARITKIAFDLGTFGLGRYMDPEVSGNYMGAFNSGLQEDINIYGVILEEGLNLFETIFGYQSLSFIPTTYTWSPKIEPILFENGVKYLQGMVHQRIPLDDDTTFKYKRNNFTGYKSKAGLIYVTRNAFFEPSQNTNFDWLGDALRRINIAFIWGKPAVISMHRLNVIGAVDERNRNKNLISFRKLLYEIKKRWSSVEFMSTDKLGILIGE